MPMSKTITVKEFAQVYGLSEYKAYQMSRSKGFPAIRHGRTVRIVAQDLDQYFRSNYGRVIKK